ncbi:MAG: leucine-rich repeat protein, partial [Oscillospiraceae bacterium]|nr:leucine-rich repeat protein [Oscillospiraceae bacterium]
MKKPLICFLAAVTSVYIGSAGINVSAVFEPNDITFSIQDQDEAPEVVVVPETTDNGKVINEVYLEDNPVIKKVVIPDTVNEVEVIRCSGITEFSVSENNPYLSVVDGILYDKDQKMLMCYPAGKTDTEFHIPDTVEVVGKCAFGGAVNLERVYIPSSVRKIETCAFADMKAKEFVFSEGVTDIENYAFNDNTELEKITLPASLERINRPFEGCTNLKEIIILHADYKGNGPSATIDLEKDAYWGFLYGCENAIAYVPDEYYDIYRREVFSNYEDNLQKISEYPYKKAYELSVNKSDITLEEGQNYKLYVRLDKRFFYEESLVFTSDNGSVAQVSEDGTITAVSAGKAVITAKAKLKNPDDPEDNVRSVSVTLEVSYPKTLSSEQVSALEELKNKSSKTIGHFPRQEMVVRGELASDAPRITYDEAINIIDASEFKKYEDILRRINNIHGAPDYSGGSGTTRVEYWLDDKGN